MANQFPTLGTSNSPSLSLKPSLGSDVEVDTLALVIPHLRSASQQQVLVGTNTLDILYSDVSSDPNFSSFEPLLMGYRAILKVLEMHQISSSSGNLGSAKLRGANPEVVPANQTVVLEGVVNLPMPHSEKCAILEQTITPALPGGLLVSASLVNLPRRRFCKLPIVLKNETNHDIVIPPGTVLALPNLGEAFSALAGSKWFSVLDLKSGYCQIEMEESDKQKTVFVCQLGFWEFNRMPHGITNAP